MTHTVNVVIATYRRPDRLRDAVASLAQSASRLPDEWAVGITLVDDDPERSAHPVAEDFADAFSLGCTYVFCGSKNISLARNAGLESALPTADWVASIDDDVVVPLHWFETYVAAIADGGHNAATGPLLKDFSQGPPWLAKEPFDRLGLLTGTDGRAAHVGATGNNWMQSDFLRRHPSLRFSPDLGKTGGEDMDFFYRAVALGLSPLFCHRAGVIEKEPPARCTLRYQLRRAFWLGLSEAHIALRLGLAGRPRLVARSLRRAANRGARQLPPEALPRRRARFTLAILAECLGLALGSLGLKLAHK